MSFFKTALFFALFLSSRATFSQASLPPLTDSIDSKILNETRGLQVIMPKSYTPGSNEKFEVVYILDGEWYYELVPFTYNFAESAHYIPKSMFVLIRNRYRDGVNLRSRDFSPTKIPEDPISGGADKFYDFLTKEVVPYVESKYPVNGHRTLVGSSFSGLFSVYSFVKDPAFFDSYVASDPNIVYDNHYVSRIANKTLDALPADAGTLFIGCLVNTSRDMGSYGFDSVLQKHAPKSMHWKVVQYPEESHYSVQLKAFYDAFRFSHGGYGVTPKIHPLTGIINRPKEFFLLFTDDAPGARFTADGSVPDSTSPQMMGGGSVSIISPAKIRVKSSGNRPEYSNEWTFSFEKGKLNPSNKKAGAGLHYAVYTVASDSLPAMLPAHAEKSGRVDSTFQLASLIESKPTLVVLEGSITIPEDAEYIFYCNGYDAMEFELAGKQLMKGQNIPGGDSYVASLTKGIYPVKLNVVRKAGDMPPIFLIFQAKPEKEKWWEGAPWKKY
ncbi:MAG: alpha/beta hydrolase [Chitinophagaceae bacterium]|nr:alpha/beta hydrolase [Chitinophagaceae bacterium]